MAHSRNESTRPSNSVEDDPGEQMTARVQLPPKFPWPQPCPTFPGPIVFAQSAGSMHGAGIRELDRNFERAGRDLRKFQKSQVQALVSEELISLRDAEILERVIDHVHSDDDARTSVRQVRGLLRSLSDDHLASPIAVTVASIAVDSMETAADSLPTDGGTGDGSNNVIAKGVAANDLGGALTGANIGKGGGIWGAIIGGLVGGIGMSWLASRDNKKK